MAAASYSEGTEILNPCKLPKRLLKNFVAQRPAELISLWIAPTPYSPNPFPQRARGKSAPPALTSHHAIIWEDSTPYLHLLFARRHRRTRYVCSQNTLNSHLNGALPERKRRVSIPSPALPRNVAIRKPPLSSRAGRIRRAAQNSPSQRSEHLRHAPIVAAHRERTSLSERPSRELGHSESNP